MNWTFAVFIIVERPLWWEGESIIYQDREFILVITYMYLHI
jgi:hypothetical protein